MDDKFDRSVDAINKEFGAQATYLVKKILDNACATGGFDRLLEVIAEMLSECKKSPKVKNVQSPLLPPPALASLRTHFGVAVSPSPNAASGAGSPSACLCTTGPNKSGSAL